MYHLNHKLGMVWIQFELKYGWSSYAPSTQSTFIKLDITQINSIVKSNLTKIPNSKVSDCRSTTKKLFFLAKASNKLWSKINKATVYCSFKCPLREEFWKTDMPFSSAKYWNSFYLRDLFGDAFCLEVKYRVVQIKIWNLFWL